MFKMKHTIYLLLTIIFIISGTGKTISQTQVHTWQKWTESFVSQTSYENPYSGVTVEVEFIGPGNSKFSTYAFWTGGQNFAATFSFPKAGNWTWRTICSDISNKGLHNRKGKVKVTDYKGDNPLYMHGFLKVSDNGRHLGYDDGTPFLWMGCTAWAGPLNATMDEWKTYIDDRAAKNFTVIQVTPFITQSWGARNYPAVGGGKNTHGDEPFTHYHYQINPSFWMDLAEKVDYANQQGMIVVLIGLPGWQLYIDDTRERRLFVEYLTGLFAGSFVIYSPSSDAPYSEKNDTLGMEIDQVDPRHLISQHPNTPDSKELVHVTSETYYDKPYLDFSMCQSGHNGGNSDRCVRNAIRWNLSLYNRTPHKPVVNTEAFYHGHPDANDRRYQGTDTDARRLGWYSWLSGSPGYTYGALGLWNWGRTTGGVTVNWKEAIRLNSSDQMNYMAGFFRKLPWWELEPYHQALLNQPDEDLAKMALAKSREGTFAVVYIPTQGSARIDMSFFKSNVRVQWFDPRNNDYYPVEGLFENKNSTLFSPPQNNDKDWVLLMQCD